MEYRVYSSKSGGYVGQGLSRGELNQWILDSYTLDKKLKEKFENYLYDEISDTEVLGKWKTPIDILLIEEE